MAELSMATWNVAAEKQSQRTGAIAEHLASRDAGITILTELTATSGLQRALTREVGPSYELAIIPTGSPYEDSLGILVTDGASSVEAVEAVDTGGKKMPHFMAAELLTPLGGISVAAMRGAYFSGRGGLFTTGQKERAVQYGMAIEVLEDEENIALIGGDMNSQARARDPFFAAAGYQRLTGNQNTWPDPEGIAVTTKDAQIIAKPFLWLGKGSSIDAIYGRGPVTSGESIVEATGLSDHLYVATNLRRTTPA